LSQRTAASAAASSYAAGIVERKGRIVASVIPDVSATTLRGTIKKFVLPGSMVYTDEFIQYRNIDREGFFHRRVYHRQGVYVSGAVHTNTIEGFFGHFKTDGAERTTRSRGAGLTPTSMNWCGSGITAPTTKRCSASF
jgi:transposase-like protein